MNTSYVTTVPATSVRLMDVWENGKVIETKAVKREGTQPRKEQFYQGAWQTADGRLFFVMENNQVVEAATPTELVNVLKNKKFKKAA